MNNNTPIYLLIYICTIINFRLVLTMISNKDKNKIEEIAKSTMYPNYICLDPALIRIEKLMILI